MNILKVILAILLPPVGVALEVGLTKHFWINVLLTILGWVPGMIHALYVVVARDSAGTGMTTPHTTTSRPTHSHTHSRTTV